MFSRHSRQWRICAVLVLLWNSTSLASFRPEIGTRALGMGGAFIGNAADATGALWNPASLANLQRGSLVYDLSQGAFSLGYPVHPIGTLGISLLDLNGDDRFFVNHPDNPIGTFERGYNQALLSYARSIGSRWQVGGNIGYSRAPYRGSRWEPGYDLGVMVEMSPRLTLGARLMDISGVVIPDENGRILKRFDQQFALGAMWQPVRPIQLSSTLDTALWQLKTGVEAGAHGFALRLGTEIDLRRMDGLNWSAGCSVNLHGKQIHYAYLSRPNVEHKHLLAFGFTFDLPSKADNRPSVTQFHGPNRKPSVEEIDETATPAVQSGPEPSSGVNQESPSSLTTQIAGQYGVELELVLAMVKTESNFNPNAVSETGAVGLTQLTPATAQEFGLKVPDYQNINSPTPNPRADERFDPRQNLEAGVKYLGLMLERYDGNYVLALAAYNAGPNSVQKNVPLAPQNERHVGKVIKSYYQYKAEPLLRDANLHLLDTILMKRGKK